MDGAITGDGEGIGEEKGGIHPTSNFSAVFAPVNTDEQNKQ